MEKEKKTHTESDVDFRGLNPFTHISAKCHSMFKHTTKQVTATTKKTATKLTVKCKQSKEGILC